jgi:hypothetical protein
MSLRVARQALRRAFADYAERSAEARARLSSTQFWNSVVAEDSARTHVRSASSTGRRTCRWRTSGRQSRTSKVAPWSRLDCPGRAVSPLNADVTGESDRGSSSGSRNATRDVPAAAGHSDPLLETRAAVCRAAGTRSCGRHTTPSRSAAATRASRVGRVAYRSL